MNDEDLIEQRKAYGQIIARAWADAEFAERLRSDPRSVLAEHGVELPGEIDLKVVFAAPNEYYMIIPPKPEHEELSDEQLDAVAGGGAPAGQCAVSAACGGCAGCCHLDRVCASGG